MICSKNLYLLSASLQLFILFTLLAKIFFLHVSFLQQRVTLILFKIYLFYGYGCYFICVGLHVCLCTVYVPDALRGQKRALDPT